MKRMRRAFTLIEVLVVLGIIALMASGITMLSMRDSTQGIDSARHSMMTAFYMARTTAISKRTPTMVIINKGSDITLRLRQVGVIYRIERENAYVGWAALDEGFVMPEGVFFVPPEGDFSSFVKLGKDVKQEEIFYSTFNDIYSGSNSQISIKEFPSRNPQPISTGSGDWYCYQFSPEGLSMNPGALVTLAMGRQNNAGIFTIDNPMRQIGFIIRKLGHKVPFSGYDEMEEVFRPQAVESESSSGSDANKEGGSDAKKEGEPGTKKEAVKK